MFSIWEYNYKFAAMAYFMCVFPMWCYVAHIRSCCSAQCCRGFSGHLISTPSSSWMAMNNLEDPKEGGWPTPMFWAMNYIAEPQVVRSVHSVTNCPQLPRIALPHTSTLRAPVLPWLLQWQTLETHKNVERSLSVTWHCDGSSYCTVLGEKGCTDIVSCQL